MANFINGQEVTQILPLPIIGTVAGFSVDQNTGEVKVLVNTADDQGNIIHSRYFSQEELK